MKKMFFLLILIITGCTNIYDINNLAIINEIAIDYNDEYIIKVKVLSSNDNEETKIYKEKCNELDECFSNLNNKLTKKLYLTHLDLLIFSNYLEKDNYKEIINFFLKEDTSRNSFPVIITNKIDDNFLNVSSKDIINLLNLSINSNGLVYTKTLNDVIKDILNYKISYVPFINTSNKEIKGYKVIYDDNKLLNKNESVIVNFILNNIKSTSLLINNKSYKIENCNTSNIINNNLTIKIRCYANKNDKNIVENYLKKEIDDFINNNNLNYFNYLKKKHNVKNSLEIKKNIKVYELNNDKGDHFE